MCLSPLKMGGGGEPPHNPINSHLKSHASSQSPHHSHFQQVKSELAPIYSPFGELIPNLTNLALQNTNFSATNALGGIWPVYMTNGTIAGIIAHLCGIPQNMPIAPNNFNKKHFLSSATCVSDILAKAGYKQVFFGGVNGDFAGKRHFLASHNIEVRDIKYLQDNGLIPNPLPKSMQGAWDLKDTEVFNMAKLYLQDKLDSQQNVGEPFVLYILTVDTHINDGVVDETRCPNTPKSTAGAFMCADTIVGDFVEFVRNSKFKDNTTIIVLGDHLSMASNFFPPQAKRAVFNAFINPKFTQTPTPQLTKERILSHFDIAPLILDSVGLRTESFGLGRNPLYQKTLLESEFSLDKFNAELGKRNKIYDSFWEVK